MKIRCVPLSFEVITIIAHGYINLRTCINLPLLLLKVFHYFIFFLSLSLSKYIWINFWLKWQKKWIDAVNSMSEVKTLSAWIIQSKMFQWYREIYKRHHGGIQVKTRDENLYSSWIYAIISLIPSCGITFHLCTSFYILVCVLSWY